MDYNHPLIEGQFLKRYKRFFADVELDGKIVVAHVPNTGSLKGICDKPRLCRVQKNDDPKRKLKYTLEQVRTESTWVGVNTHNANNLGWEAFINKTIPHWEKYSAAIREVKINPDTRLDLKLISSKGLEHFVEIKSVTLNHENQAQFPDAVTSRGQKHIKELILLAEQGFSTELLFIIQRDDCKIFSPAEHTDPTYAQLLRDAKKIGVKISAYPATLSCHRIILDTKKNIKIWLRQERHQ